MSSKVSENSEEELYGKSITLEEVEKAESIGYMKCMLPTKDSIRGPANNWTLRKDLEGVLCLLNTEKHEFKVVKNASEILNNIVHHTDHDFDQLRLVKIAS